MPARLEEVKHAKEEGVEFLTLHNPIEYIADEKGCVKRIVLQKMELGEPDASGRRSPVPIEGAIETIDIDMAVVSVGVSPNPLFPHRLRVWSLVARTQLQLMRICSRLSLISMRVAILFAAVPPLSLQWVMAVTRLPQCTRC